MIKIYDGNMKMYCILGMSLNVHVYSFKMSVTNSYCQLQVTFIQVFISKQLHGNKEENNSINVAKFINYETTSISDNNAVVQLDSGQC